VALNPRLYLRVAEDFCEFELVGHLSLNWDGIEGPLLYRSIGMTGVTVAVKTIGSPGCKKGSAVLLVWP